MSTEMPEMEEDAAGVPQGELDEPAPEPDAEDGGNPTNGDAAPESGAPAGDAESHAVSEPEPLESDNASESSEGEQAPTPEPEPQDAAVPSEEPAGEDDTAYAAAVPQSDPGARRAALADARNRRRMLMWPFVAYATLWAVFIGVLAWQLMSLPDGMLAYTASVYAWGVWSGVALLALAPIVILVSWLGARRPGENANHGVFSVALLRGAIVTAAGVTLWWIALAAVDYVRLGRLF